MTEKQEEIRKRRDCGMAQGKLQDDQGADPIVDGDYYVPFYAALTA